MKLEEHRTLDGMFVLIVMLLSVLMLSGITIAAWVYTLRTLLEMLR